jgi:hypothetical protein
MSTASTSSAATSPDVTDTAATATTTKQSGSTRSRAPRRPKLDPICAEAVDLARSSLEEAALPGQVGEHLGVEVAGERLVSHFFACEMPGYRGWRWNIVLARAPRAKQPTVCETALLPSDGALLAPAWQPWAERLRPDDVGQNDLLPYQEQDERLEQGYEQTDDAEADRVAQWELGLGRTRVLSPEGRGEAADRWAEGDFGPRQVSTRKRRGTVTATCASCGFLTPISGSLRQEFGVCTNEWSPADGHVVHLGYGCGSHSETGKDVVGSDVNVSENVVVDEIHVDYESVDTDATPEGTQSASTDSEDPAKATAAEDTPAEVAEDMTSASGNTETADSEAEGNGADRS